MGWLRSHGKKLCWLALFALASHFVVTFGHVHFEDLKVAPSVLTKLTDALDHSPAAPPPTAPKKRLKLTPDFCAVCASINIAYAMVLPDSPGIIPFASFAGKLRRSLAAAEIDQYDRFFVRARGPPYA